MSNAQLNSQQSAKPNDETTPTLNNNSNQSVGQNGNLIQDQDHDSSSSSNTNGNVGCNNELATNDENNSNNNRILQDDNTLITTGPVRVPGTYPPEWLPDHETNTCMSCDSLFTLIKRRHHCRSCGKIFCGDCCRQKAKLLYLENKEARVCSNCFNLLEYTLLNPEVDINNTLANQIEQIPSPSSSNLEAAQTRSTSNLVGKNNNKVQGVLKSTSQIRERTNECNTSSTSSSSDQQLNKQVIFSDGIRPGTDLSESFPYPVPTSSSSGSPVSTSFSLLTRQNRTTDGQNSSLKRGKSTKSQDYPIKNITVCDELGYLPPIVIGNNSKLNNYSDSSPVSSSSLTSIIVNQFRLGDGKKTIQSSMESRNCPLNGIVKFEEISSLVGEDDIVTFLILKDFHLKVKLIKKPCCIDKNLINQEQQNKTDENQTECNNDQTLIPQQIELPQYWCFASEGLTRFGQNEIILVVDKEKDDSCVPRDVFKIYLTLHELALRRQSLENLGNLLFQDGLFDNRDTAGLLFFRPLKDHCLKNLVLPSENFLVALVLQRWEVPWSKVFPMRLLLRLGHKFNCYPYPIISIRVREPVYYEVGHTIISILGDFRNFRYSITHVDGLKVMLNKKTRKVLVKLNQSSYQQFNKVLDSSNNEHVLAWSCSPFSESHGHLVSVQNEDGQYETVEFYKKTSEQDRNMIPSDSDDSESGVVLGASFLIFSGALKVNQTGQSAKISIVEDGLLIQIQSCTMSALRNAIHYMHHFDIDCGKCCRLFNYSFDSRFCNYK